MKKTKSFYSQLSLILILTSVTAISAFFLAELFDNVLEIGLGNLWIIYGAFLLPHIFNFVIFRIAKIERAFSLTFFSILTFYSLQFLAWFFAILGQSFLENILYPFGWSMFSWVVAPIAYGINFYILNLKKLNIKFRYAVVSVLALLFWVISISPIADSALSLVEEKNKQAEKTDIFKIIDMTGMEIYYPKYHKIEDPEIVSMHFRKGETRNWVTLRYKLPELGSTWTRLEQYLYDPNLYNPPNNCGPDDHYSDYKGAFVVPCKLVTTTPKGIEVYDSTRPGFRNMYAKVGDTVISWPFSFREYIYEGAIRSGYYWNVEELVKFVDSLESLSRDELSEIPIGSF